MQNKQHMCKVFKDVNMHMALVEIYHVMEELSYFYFLQNKNPKYFCSKK